jgi:hypothetical protein
MGASVGLDVPPTSAAASAGAALGSTAERMQALATNVLTTSTNPTISVLFFINDLLIV